jgi:membrane associated rhomboid family serine protease
MAGLCLNEAGGTAWFAHIGGFITGVIFNYLFKMVKIE